MLNLILFVLLILAVLSLIFPHPLAFVINYVLQYERPAEIRILTKTQFIDVDTNEIFYVWRGAYGLRLWLASLVLKV